MDPVAMSASKRVVERRLRQPVVPLGEQHSRQDPAKQAAAAAFAENLSTVDTSNIACYRRCRAWMRATECISTTLAPCGAPEALPMPA
jgi:hypothetical protein